MYKKSIFWAVWVLYFYFLSVTYAYSQGVKPQKSVWDNAFNFVPKATDSLKTIRLYFVFFKPPHKNGGFDIAGNKQHERFFTDLVGYMNWQLSTFRFPPKPEDCGATETIDTKIRFELVKMETVENEYYWNNENGDLNKNGNCCEPADICPGNDNWYILPFHNEYVKKIDPQKQGIILYFTENARLYAQISADTTLKSKCCNIDCSMMPLPLQANAPVARIHMLDQFLAYTNNQRIDYETDSLFWAENNNDYKHNVRVWTLSSFSSLFLHELGHALGLTHGPPACNLMNPNGMQAALTPYQLGTCHKTLCVNNLSNYVINACSATAQVLKINTPQVWTSEMQIYENIEIENGGVLCLQNATLKMPPNAYILVKKGGKLVIKENVLITCACSTEQWQGVKIMGKYKKKVKKEDKSYFLSENNFSTNSKKGGAVVIQNTDNEIFKKFKNKIVGYQTHAEAWKQYKPK